MIDVKTAPYGILMLRVSLGLLFLAHAGLKFFVFTPAGAAGFFESVGLPGVLAPLTIVVETLGAIALITGLFARFAAVVLLPIVLGSILFVHGANGWLFTNANGGWEFPALWAVGLCAITLSGSGAFSLVWENGSLRFLRQMQSVEER